jgi:hypothetical protein
MRIKLNTDSKKVEEIRKAVEENKGYCPCKIERVINNYCPCRDFRYKLECCCDLYIKVED